MGAIRSLYTDLRLRATDAVKGLKAYDKLWKTVAASVDASATSIERAADRASSALARIAEGAAVVRSTVPRAAGGPSSAPARAPSSKGPATRRGPDPLDKAIRAANIGEAGRAGLAAGSVAIKEATAALGPLASKTDAAKAKIADLTAQVERNRKEMADLKRKTIEVGDADGTLAARSAGLATAQKDVAISLGQARRGLSEVRGGLIDNIKAAADLSARFGVLKVAAGNMLSSAVQGIGGKVVDGLKGATTAAVDFESSLVGISKVARGTDDTAEGFERIKAGIKATSKELGVLPTEVSDLTAQLAPAFSGVKEGASDTAVDIVALANDVTKIGVAWDITGKEAGKSFAEISSGLQLTTDQTKSLFGGINEIGNQLGVNAATLAESVQRSAGVLKGANISGETGAALNAVLIKTGSSAEVAATGVRTFIGRLGAGETKGQLKAFKALNLDMVELRKNMANGGAEQEIKKVVDALAGLKNEERLSVLAEMFGTESIGSIGAAATATDLLAQSMSIMGDKTAAATSVQKEFDRVAATSKSKIAALKANIEVLAIEFGERLLPYVNKIVAFLTSKEGQEWGAKAVEKAVAVVTGLADALGVVGGILSGLIETFGGAGVAVAGLGVAVAALAGPWGIAAAAAGAAIALMTAGITSLIDTYIPQARESISGLFTDIQELDKKRRDEAQREKDVDDDLDRRTSINAGPSFGMGPAPMAKPLPGSVGQTGADKAAAKVDKRALFDDYSARIAAGGKLRPSEAAEYTRLSKELDEAKATKRGKGHKATKMDKQLAAMDPSVRALVTRGGDEDAGGDSMVAGNALDRAVLDRSSKSKGLGGVDGMGGVGPGPNINNTYVNINTEVNNAIDARSTAPISDNIRSASQDLGVRLGQVIVTGGEKLIAARNAGGVMRGPAA